MASDSATNTRSSFSGRQVPIERSAYRLDVLRTVEEALTKARIDAQDLEHPVLAYFLDMAMAELKNCEAAEEGGLCKINTFLRSVS